MPKVTGIFEGEFEDIVNTSPTVVSGQTDKEEQMSISEM